MYLAGDDKVHTSEYAETLYTCICADIKPVQLSVHFSAVIVDKKYTINHTFFYY